MRLILKTAVAALALIAVNSPAHAEYPDKPITVIIPFSTGGGSDTGVRTWGPFVEACVGQPLVMLNKTGAGGAIGFTELATSTPDGYTIGIVVVPNMPVQLLTSQNLKFSTESFEYLYNFYQSVGTVNVLRGGKFNSLADLVEKSKETPVTFAITGFGSDDHLTALKFAKASGAKLNFIPMADTAAVRNAIGGGHVDAAGMSVQEAAPFQDRLHTLAVAAEERAAGIPDTPTFIEQGYNFTGGSRHVVSAPAGTPPEAVAKLVGCFEKVGTMPEFLAAARTRNMTVAITDQEKTKKWVVDESAALKALWETDPWIK